MGDKSLAMAGRPASMANMAADVMIVAIVAVEDAGSIGFLCPVFTTSLSATLKKDRGWTKRAYWGGDSTRGADVQVFSHKQDIFRGKPAGCANGPAEPPDE
jgi:hypothetical protein